MEHIDFDALHRLTGVRGLIEPLRRAFASDARSPDRAHYDLGPPDQPRTLLLMPSWQSTGYVGVKIATVFPGNAERGLPSVNAAYLLMSGQTGEPLAWIDGRALTLLRTAAVSALAADLLAPAEAKVFLMVGTGALAPYLIEGHCGVRDYDSVLIWGRDTHKAQLLARELKARGRPTSVATDLEGAARSADVISCATLACRPLIEGAWLNSACHLNLIGGYRPDMREADDASFRHAYVVVDTLAALHESGDLAGPLATGVIKESQVMLLNELASQSRFGNVASFATPASRTVFKSVGVAHADLAAAQYIYRAWLAGASTSRGVS
jgi:ornithine cyclodeaminase